MTGDRPSRLWSWRAHELKAFIAFTAASLSTLVIGISLGNGPIAGLSLMLLIFFATYTAYAYYRRDL